MNFWTNLIEWDEQAVLAINAIHAPMMDRFAWLLSETMVWLPALIAIIYVLVKNKRAESILIIITVALLITFVDQIAADVIKPLVARPRPTRNMELIPLLEVVNGYHGGAYGFPSNHAANVFAVAMFTLLLFRNNLYTCCILLWAVLVSMARIYLSVHYPLDVIGGACFGALSGYLFYILYGFLSKQLPSKKISYNYLYSYTSSFYLKKDVYLVLIVMGIILTTLLISSHYIY